MSQAVSNWLVGLTCTALLAALADSLMPAGAVRQVGRLTCALVLLIAVLRPLLWRGELPSDALEGLTTRTQERQQELSEQSDAYLKSLIEEQMAAYIVDKAAELGIECRAQVSSVQGEGGLWLPHSVHITGRMEDARRRTLERLICDELGIEPEQQSYVGGESDAVEDT